MTEPELPPRIDPATIPAHRAAGWPYFHPEHFCHRCGERNPSWWTPEWDAIRGDHYVTIVCPSCFCALHAVTTGERTPWRLIVDASEPGISPALLARLTRAEARADAIEAAAREVLRVTEYGALVSRSHSAVLALRAALEAS